MKKKSMYVAGAMLLTAAFGFSALAVSGIIPTPFSAASTANVMPTAAAVLPLGSTSPAQNAVVPNYPAVTQVYFEFPTGGDNGCVLMKTGENVIVKKDGAELYKFSVGASEYVYIHRNYQDRLIVDFPQALEPGEYTVEIPAGIVSGAIAGDSSIETTDGENAAQTLHFTVKKSFEYSVAPKQDAEVMPSQLATVTITYPEGSTVTVNPDPTGYATLVFVDPTYVDDDGNASTKYTDLTAYEVKAQGNVVTLTAIDNEKIEPNVFPIDRQWNAIKVPAGLWTVTQGATSEVNTAMELGKYAIRAISADAIKFTPALDTPNLTMADLEEITITLPADLEWVSPAKPNANTTICTLYPDPLNTSFYFFYKFKEWDETHKVIKCTRAVATKSTVLANNAEIVQTGSTTMRINANALQAASGQKNAQLNFPAWNVKGREEVVIYNSTPVNGGVIANTGLNSLKLNAVRNTYITNPDALIVLRHNGTKVRSVAMGKTTTAAALDPEKGATIIDFAKLFVDADGLAFTEPGAYSFNIPAKSLKQVGTEWVNNDDIVITAYVPQGLPHEIYPAPATLTVKEGVTAANVKAGDIEITAGKDGNLVNEVILTYPDAVKIEISPDYKNVLANSAVGRVSFANYLKSIYGGIGGTTVSPSISTPSGYSANLNVEVIGKNQVKITFNEMPYATPATFIPAIKIKGGLFIVTQLNEYSAPEQFMNVEEYIFYPQTPMMAPVIDTPSTVEPISGASLSRITIEAKEDLYNNGSTKATLYNDKGEVVSYYVGTNNDDGQLKRFMNFIPDTKANAAADPAIEVNLEDLAAGKYTFTIAAEALYAGNSNTGSTLFVTNDKAYSYEFTVEQFNLPENIALFEPNSNVFNLKTAPFGPTQFVWMINREGAVLNEACTEPIQVIYEGEKLFEIALNSENVMFVPNYADTDIDPMAEGDDVAEEPKGPAMLGITLLDAQVVMPEPEEPAEPSEPAEPTEPAEPVVLGEQLLQMLGSYQIILPKGALIAGDLKSEEYVINYTYESVPADFTHELAPAAGEKVESLNSIMLTFTASNDVDYTDGVVVGTLTCPDGTVLDCKYPQVHYGETSTGLEFKYENADWKPGKYTFTVVKDAVIVDKTPFEGLTAEYEIVAMPLLKDHASLQVPPAADCDALTAKTFFGSGMGVIALGLDSDKIDVNTECAAPIVMTYNGELLKEIYTKVNGDEEPSVAIMSAGLMADDELPVFDANISLYMMFDRGATPEPFQRDGTYTVTIPDGALTYEGLAMKGLTLTYNYTNKADLNFTWSISPDPKTVITEDPSTVLNKITVTFNEAYYIDFNGKAGGKLVNPAGNAMQSMYPTPTYSQPCTLTYEFKATKTAEWLNKGTYQFSIAKGEVSINDMTFTPDDKEVGNFEGLTVVYNVDAATSVAMLGVEAADSYNIYTVDGKVVKLNAAPAELFELENGLYIINGQKAYIRK